MKSSTNENRNNEECEASGGKRRLTPLILLLRSHLMGADIRAQFPSLSSTEWNDLYALARSHGVTGFAYEGAFRANIEIPAPLKFIWRQKMISDIQHYYSLQKECLHIIHLFRKNDIKPVILKGFSVSQTYPIPELRLMGDTDILIPEKFYQAALILESAGYRARKEVAVHHVEFAKDRFLLELHRAPFTPIGKKSYDRLIQAVAFTGDKYEYLDLNGNSIPVLCEEDFINLSFEHILKHLIHDRMALSNICDILMLFVSYTKRYGTTSSLNDSGQQTSWENGDKDWSIYYNLIESCGIAEHFSGIISFLVHAFGLPLDAVRGIKLLGREEADAFADKVFSVTNVRKGANRYYADLSLSGTFLMLGRYLKAVSRDMLIKYPYCRKTVFLRPVAFIHAYVDYAIELVRKLAGRLV